MRANGTTPAETGSGSEATQPSFKLNGSGGVAEKKSIFDDMEALRAASQAAFGGEQEEASSIVKAGRPAKSVYFRCPTNSSLYLAGMIWGRDGDNKSYFVAPRLWALEDLQGGLRAVLLAPWMGADGTLGLWPVPCSNENEWAISAMAAVNAAKTRWIRVQSDRRLGRYRVFDPHQALPDRAFPPLSLADICAKAFSGDGVVDSEDHKLIRQLRGISDG